VSVVRHIGGLLQAGKSIKSIIDAIQLAATETLIECGSPAAYNMPMHAYEYVNTVRWFYDRLPITGSGSRATKVNPTAVLRTSSPWATS
jgi:hypothetical protein